MNAPPHRAFRFLHPDLDEAAGAAGLRLSATGGLEMVDGHASIRQAVLLLLSTLPGERVMRPGYGCDLHRLLFQPNDDTTAGLAIHYVRSAVETWEPRVELLAVDATRHPEIPGRLDVSLTYRVRATGRRDGLTLPVSLTGEPR
jgi:phage baseplate assembly protein W